MRSSLTIPREWIAIEIAQDLLRDLSDFASALHDYSNFSVFSHESGVTSSALPTFELMATKAKLWMPKLLEDMSRCDMDPALYPRILQINTDDWQSWKKGELESVSIDTFVRGQLLWEILSFLYCDFGSWEIVSGFLNKETRLHRLNNKCPVHMIESGDIMELARLHDLISGEVLGAPYL